MIGVCLSTRCYEPYFGAKILAPHPNLTSDAALYVINPATGCVINRNLRTPVYRAPNAEARGVREVPYKDPAVRAAKGAAWRQANQDKIAAWRDANRGKIAAWNAAYYAVNREYFREYYRSDRWREFDAKRRADPEYKAQQAASASLRAKRLRATPGYKPKPRVLTPEQKAHRREYWKRPEVLAAQRARAAKVKADPVKAAVRQASKQRWIENPENRFRTYHRYRFGSAVLKLHIRMSNGVRQCLRSNKRRGSRWLDLVGYSLEELRTHIERQFLPRMGWHNMHKWHVDHILPVSSFKFQSADDPEFKAAWALTNLRPVWAAENLRKNARREHLL